MTQTSKTDWERLAKMKDKEIDTSDIPELDAEFFRRAELRVPVKQAVTIRWMLTFLSGSKVRVRATRHGSTNCCVNTCRPIRVKSASVECSPALYRQGCTGPSWYWGVRLEAPYPTIHI